MRMSKIEIFISLTLFLFMYILLGYSAYQYGYDGAAESGLSENERKKAGKTSLLRSMAIYLGVPLVMVILLNWLHNKNYV